MPAEQSTPSLPSWRDKALFTPGPLTTSRTVKQAMLRDLGSRDTEFLAIVRAIRGRLLALGAVAEPEYTAVPMQGSGTFGVEAVLASVVPAGGRVLVASNGAYGQRIGRIARVLGIDVVPLDHPEHVPIDPAQIARALEAKPDIALIAVVHCETTTGIVNPIERIGEMTKGPRTRLFVDAMSSFGAVPIDLAASGIDYLVSSANKCIEGVPGFSFVLARRAALEATAGWARSVSLDLHAQWKGLENNGQFRFTPPTHALLAFDQALTELDWEGGVAGRAARYRANYETLIAGMRSMGFAEYLPPERQGYIITSFRYPAHSRFRFEEFYQRLSERGFVIYPGKVTDADCFRIGNIGRIFPADVSALLAAIADVLGVMGVSLETAGMGRV